MDWYVEFVSKNPIFSAIIQFAILGTLGDLVARWIVSKKIHLPYSKPELFFKLIEWSFLGILIKYAFIGYQGFVESLVAQNYLPEPTPFTRAFFISLTMNAQFGILLVLLHRLLDNLIHKVSNWSNIDKGLLSLIWFWIPAHTVTFLLPPDFRIGLAALWSVVLGLILGYYNMKKK
ncbi:MAG: hypothetical protein GX452_05400 [Ignavibacteriales bacterium]|nr:hypothetical protein [Ignavibacteriales bacterium]HOJ17546.1 hypothetical protein [Ignavibacteriaceae bacterium]